LRRRFFFAPRHGALDRTGIDSHLEAPPDGFDNGLFAVGRLTPLLHEIQDLVGALVSTPRAAPTRQQPWKATVSKTRIRDVESLPADPEQMNNLRDRLAINTVPAEHLVPHLDKIPRIEEITGTKSFVLDVLGMAVERTLLSEGPESGIV
jgi:hypothetical protein